MFRIITENQPKASLFFLCDHPHCAMIFNLLAPNDLIQERMEVFAIQSAVKDGWLLQLSKHLCPVHAKPAVEARRVIQVAQRMPGVLN